MPEPVDHRVVAHRQPSAVPLAVHDGTDRPETVEQRERILVVDRIGEVGVHDPSLAPPAPPVAA